jgi:protocatechuate 3,4-dioxygenase beta subunit
MGNRQALDRLYARRDLVLGSAAVGLASLPILACARQGPAAPARGRLIAGETCPATPAQTEGPFYFDPRLVRQDIAEGRPGVPLRLRLQIVDAEACAPLRGARVDLWHCDAAGTYSGYDGEGSAGETFLRGTQFADADGIVSFATVYPGWYQGRATHIHCKAWTDAGREVTSQAYFPDELSDAVYQGGAYARRGGRRLLNRDDGIFRRAGGGEATLIEVRRTAEGYDGAIVVALA